MLTPTLKMKRLLFMIMGLVISLVACSDRFQVFSDSDPDLDVLVYKTYAWPARTEIESRNNPLLYNELTDKRIQKAIDLQLLGNGYAKVDSAPGLKVHYHIVVNDKTITLLDNPHSDSYTPYWLGGRDTFRYQEGTLIVDLMDAKTCNLVWRGWAVGVIENYTTILTEKEITKAINKIFRNYPKHPRVKG